MADLVERYGRADVRDKVETGEALVKHIDAGHELESDDIGELVQYVAKDLTSMNFKVCLTAIQLVDSLVKRYQRSFAHHIDTVMPGLRERLGDSKDEVREATVMLLVDAMDEASTPHTILDHVLKDLEHRNWRVRASILSLFLATLEKHGVADLHLSRLVDRIPPLLSDRNETVRDNAFDFVVEAYRHVGSPVRRSLQRSKVPPQKLSRLMDTFEELRHSGTMLAEDTGEDATGGGSGSSATATTVPSRRSAHSRKGSEGSGGRGSTSSAPRSRSASTSRQSTIPKAKSRIVSWRDPNRNKDGSVSESAFVEALQETEPLSVTSERQLEDEVNEIGRTLANDGIDWEKRRDMLIRLRRLVAGGATSMHNFLPALKAINDAMVTSISDLRSGIVKEACLTIGHLAQSVGNAFGAFFDVYFPALLKQANVNIKVIQTSAQQCIRFFIRHVHYPRTFQRLAEYKASRSVSQRRLIAEVYLLVLQTWPAGALGKHSKSIVSYLRTAIGDADSIVRSTARQAYWQLHSDFPDVATRLFNELDAKTQKTVMTDKNKVARRSATSSSSSIGSGASSSSLARRSQHHQQHHRPSAGNLRRKPTDIRHSLRSKSQEDVNKQSHLGKASSLDPSYVSAPTSPETRRRAVRNEDTAASSRARHAADARRRRSALVQTTTRPSSRSKSASISTPHGQRGGSRSSTTQQPPRKQRLSAIAPSPSRLPRASSALSASGRFSAGSPSPGSTRPRRQTEGSASASRTSLRGQREALSSFGQAFAQVLEDSKSADWSVRLQAVQDLKELARGSAAPTARELNRVCSYFARQLAEPHTKVFMAVVDTIAEVVVIYQRELPPGWLRDVVPTLLLKFGGGVQPKTQEKVLHLLDLIRNTFPPQLQISNLFKFLIDQSLPQNTKVKVATVEYLGGVLTFAKPRDLADVHDLSPSEYRSAMRSVIQMTNEPKSVDLRRAATSVLVMVFEVHPPLFARIVAALPLAEADAARQILTVHVRDWELRTEQPVDLDDAGGDDDGDDDDDDDGDGQGEEGGGEGEGEGEKEEGMPEKLTDTGFIRSGVPGGRLHEREEDDAEEDERRRLAGSLTRSAREAQLPTRTPQRGGGEERAAALSAERGHPHAHERQQQQGPELKENQGVRIDTNGRSQESKSYNPSTYQDTGLNGLETRDDASPPTRGEAMDGRRLTYEELVEARRQEYRRNRERLQQQQHKHKEEQQPQQLQQIGQQQSPPQHDSQQSLTSQGSRVSMDSADSAAGEALKHVERAIDTLKSSQEDESITKTLHWLIRVSREGRQSLWKYHFRDLLNVLLELLNDDEAPVREQALRVLREMLKNQGTYFRDVIPEVLPKVLECHVENCRSIMHVADEALTHLSNLSPTRTSLQLLEPFLSSVDDLSQPVLLASIRYLTKVISRGDQETVESMTDSYLPGLLKSFRHTAPEVRKAVVTALVQFCLLVSEERAKPYLTSLSSGQQKLVEVYIQRAKDGSRTSQV